MAALSPPDEELLIIGTIVAPFGIKGQVKLRSLTDHPEHLSRNIRTVYVGPARSAYQVRKVFEHKPGLLVMTLRDVDTRDAAEDLRGFDVAILEREAVPLAQGEYYLHQLYGLRVETVDGEEIGTVRELIETGANEVLVVKREAQSDVLIPMINDVVKELDLPGGRVVIEIIPGLL
jgi:16S rRNA processing protein RimM